MISKALRTLRDRIRKPDLWADSLTPFKADVTPDPAAAKALERAWQKSREQLGDWRPSNGWLVDPATRAAK